MVKVGGKGFEVVEEYWVEVNGYEGFYEVSNYGNVRSVDRLVKCSRGDNYRLWKGKVLSQICAAKGYYQVSLSKEGVISKCYVHRLVMESFWGDEFWDQTVNHINGDKLDNTLDNLEWCSYSENNKHAFDAGLKQPSPAKGYKE